MLWDRILDKCSIKADSVSESESAARSNEATPVSRSSSSPVPGVVAFGEIPITARTAPHVTNRDDACRMQIHCRARSSRLRSRKEE